MKKEEAGKGVEIQAAVQMGHHTLPHRVSVSALQTGVREKAPWGHTRPAQMPLYPGQPDLFRLLGRGCRCPLHSVKGTLRGERRGKGRPPSRAPRHTHTY